LEEIPDDDRLFRRAHRSLFQGQATRDDDYIPAGVIKKEQELSTDWSRYSTPEQSRARAKHPEANGVISLPVGPVRSEALQSVEHAPEPENRAHSLVIGSKDEETRVLLLRMARWEIRLPHSGATP
jgi:hypothetical protein